MLCSVLEEHFDVIEAENGLTGLDELRAHYDKLALVLLDVYMPECDGFEFLRRRSKDERYASVPVMVATASGSVEDEIKCLELGANDFITKPYNFDIMLNRINNTIALRESASIVNQLMYDDITGLYSKNFFYRVVEDQLVASPDQDYDIVCSDIESFKSLNDRYGHERCDGLLAELARILTDVLPGFAAGGRIGSDVFAFLIEHQERGWEQMLPQALESVAGLDPNIKIGVLEHIDRELSVALSCDRAIMAFENVRNHVGVNVGWYDDELRQRQIVKQVIVDTMESALHNEEFVVWYQPKHDVRSNTTGGAEALARWFHPKLGFVSPGVFIPIFEENGFITQLDMYIWETACKQIKRCHDLGLPAVPISINASRLDFDIPDLADRIETLADKYDVDHALLHVEITETAYSDSPEKVERILRDLRSRGFRIELDDFGAGYSSLASLNTLPLDVMKLDMSLVRQATKLQDFRIVNSAIELARIMGLGTVVEGVEEVEEVEKLIELGCDLIQGYYYSKPLKPEEFEEYLAR